LSGGAVENKRSVEFGQSASVDLKAVVVVGAVRIVYGLIDPPIVGDIKAGRIVFPVDRIIQIPWHIAAVVVSVIVVVFAVGGIGRAVGDVVPVIAGGGVVDVVDALLIGSPDDAAVVSVVWGWIDA